MNQSVFVLIPVHNRKSVTLNCLAHLASQGDLESFHVVIIDDGSTDGTMQVIEDQYPQVHGISGSGELWWTGAIKAGMEYAYSQGAEYFIWLNDDTLPEANAISTLIYKCSQQQPCVISAQCYETSQYERPTYGGQRLIGLTHKPVIPPCNGDISCDSLSGNLVCIPRSAVDSVGFPPAEKLPHYQGDTVYTWTLKQAGFKVMITNQAKAICPKNPGSSSWLASDIPIIDLWRSLATPKSAFYVKGFWHFCMALWGPLGMLMFIQPYCRLSLISLIKWIVPKGLLQKITVT